MAGGLRGCTCIFADSDDFSTNRLKRVKSNTIEEDRLSALPDFLILRILSFLSTEEVFKTCLLSKRWQFIWTGISKVDLNQYGCDTAKIRRFVDFVGRMVSMCTSLNKFAVNFLYSYRECFASNVNFWVDSVVKNKVKDINLSCRCGSYELPQILYSHSSLTSFNISHCAIAPRGAAIEWGSLKSLLINDTEFSNCVMEKILTGCPVLEVLNLTSVSGFSSLNICSQNLTTLEIDEFEVYVEKGSFVEISAPYVRDLSISGYVERKRFRLKSVSSVVRAELEFHALDNEECDIYTSPDTMIYINQLFQSLDSAKELELGLWCIEVLSMLEVKGWLLPPSTRSCLTLRAFGHEGSIPGIIGILKSSPYLETLVIEGQNYFPFDPEEDAPINRDPAVAYLANGNLDLTLFHLKTIKISNFTGLSYDDDTLPTLVQLLLKNAKVLEKMVINPEELFKFLPFTKSRFYLADLALKLLTFPRASTEATVVVT